MDFHLNGSFKLSNRIVATVESSVRSNKGPISIQIHEYFRKQYGTIAVKVYIAKMDSKGNLLYDENDWIETAKSNYFRSVNEMEESIERLVSWSDVRQAISKLCNVRDMIYEERKQQREVMRLVNGDDDKEGLPF